MTDNFSLENSNSVNGLGVRKFLQDTFRILDNYIIILPENIPQQIAEQISITYKAILEVINQSLIAPLEVQQAQRKYEYAQLQYELLMDYIHDYFPKDAYLESRLNEAITGNEIECSSEELIIVLNRYFDEKTPLYSTLKDLLKNQDPEKQLELLMPYLNVDPTYNSIISLQQTLTLLENAFYQMQLEIQVSKDEREKRIEMCLQNGDEFLIYIDETYKKLISADYSEYKEFNRLIFETIAIVSYKLDKGDINNSEVLVNKLKNIYRINFKYLCKYSAVVLLIKTRVDFSEKDVINLSDQFYKFIIETKDNNLIEKNFKMNSFFRESTEGSEIDQIENLILKYFPDYNVGDYDLISTFRALYEDLGGLGNINRYFGEQ